MKIILLEEVEALGLPGDVVDVARGYAQNYLIPTRQAVMATAGQLHDLQKKLDAKRKKAEIERAGAAQIAEMLADKLVLIPAKAGEAGKLYGSVTAGDIAEAVKDTYDIDLDRKKYQLTESIKMLGSYVVRIKVHFGVEASVQVIVYDEQTGPPSEASEMQIEEAEALADTVEMTEPESEEPEIEANSQEEQPDS